MTPEQALDAGAWMLFYLFSTAVVLYSLLSMFLVTGKVLSSIPLERNGNQLSWKEEKVVENPLVHPTVVFGMWMWILVILVGGTLLLGYIAILLGVPIPE